MVFLDLPAKKYVSKTEQTASSIPISQKMITAVPPEIGLAGGAEVVVDGMAVVVGVWVVTVTGDVLVDGRLDVGGNVVGAVDGGADVV